MPKYKWDTPHEWLMGRINSSDDPIYLRGVIISLLTEMDSDMVQDAFQSDMDRDGYFDPATDSDD